MGPKDVGPKDVVPKDVGPTSVGLSDVDPTGAGTDTGVRPLRADARRNRDAVLATAAQLFAERGAQAPLEEIARTAGVGIGTLYRHFPTREALIASVYRREVETLCAAADELLTTLPPDQALQEWMQRFVRYVGLKKGLAMTLKAGSDGHSELFVYSRTQIREALGRLIHSGVQAGAIRSGIEPMDLLLALGGLCSGSEQPGWEDTALLMVGVLVDGLRYRGAAPPASAFR